MKDNLNAMDLSVDRTYLCIDLKSFYASVECVERKLDPMDTLLVVADNSRTEKTSDIIAEIKTGLDLSGRSKSLFIEDREQAIRTAIMTAEPGDVILLAGKGHETYQIIGTEKRHFDEKEIVNEVFSERTA